MIRYIGIQLRTFRLMLLLGTAMFIHASDKAEPTVTYLKNRIDVSFQLEKHALKETVAQDGQTYTIVSHPLYGNRADPGQPGLPVIEALIETTRTTPRPKVLLKRCSWNEDQLISPILPAQAPIPKTPGAMRQHTFQRNKRSYESAGFINPWSIKSGTWYRLTPVTKAKIDYLHLELFLYAFNPKSQTIRYPTELAISLSWVDGSPASLPLGFRRTGPVTILSVDASTKEARNFLTSQGFDITRRRGNVFTLYAANHELAKLRQQGFDMEILANAAPAKAHQLKRQKKGKPDVYQDYEALTDFLQSLALTYPELCRLESIGQSVEGRDIWAVKLSDNVKLQEDEPQARLVSAMHGDEPVGTVLSACFLNHLLSSYEHDSHVRRLINETELWVIPLFNPDGFSSGKRYNANGIDLNRNFPDRVQDQVNSPLGREPEVAAMMQFCESRNFILAANLQAGDLVVGYPYDGNAEGENANTPTPDDTLFRTISKTYAGLNPAISASEIYPEGISNGAGRNPAYGSLQDWSYAWQKTNEVTIEISREKWPEASKLPGIWKENRESLMAFFATIFTSVSGIVRDKDSGEVIPHAIVTVKGIDHSVEPNPCTGRYHRMLPEGTYAMTVSAPGYSPETRKNIMIKKDQITQADFSLRKRKQKGTEAVLVVSRTDFTDSAQAMVNYYINRGYASRLLTFSGALSPGQIRTLIQNAYGTEPFHYLLLIGDTDTLPPFQREKHVSDLLYSLLDTGESWEDYLGRDVVVGRLPFRENADFENYQHKLTDFLGNSRNERFAWISNGYDDGECSIAEGTHQWVMNEILSNDDYHVTLPCDDGTVETFLSEINNRLDVVTYSGHGGSDCWVRWDFDVQDLASIQNEGDPPAVFSHACDTGRFEFNPCFGEAWLLTRDRGVIFIGASNSTYWDEDDVLEKVEFQELFAQEPATIGQALWAGLSSVDQQSMDGLYYHEIYHIFGDPTLRISSSFRLHHREWVDGNNGIMEAGETGELALTIVNQLENMASNVTLSLNTDSAMVTLQSNEFSLGTIDRGEQAQAVFSIQIDPACPAGHIAVCELNIASDQSSPFKRTLNLVVHEVSQIAGQVLFEETGQGASEAMISATGPENRTTQTDAEGRFTMSLIEGTYDLTATLDSYFQEHLSVTVPPNSEDLVFSLGWAEGKLTPEEISRVIPPNSEEKLEVSLHNPGIRPLSFTTTFRNEGDCPPKIVYDTCDAPPYQWESTANAALISRGEADDDSWGPIDIGFPFPIYGQVYNTFHICSNGFLSFYMPNTNYDNSDLPSTNAPSYMIAALWDDLSINADGSTHVLKEEDRCVVTWSSVSHYDGSPAFAIQVMLFSDGRILFQYNNIPWSSLSATVGVQGRFNEGFTVSPDELTDFIALLCPREEADNPAECSLQQYNTLTPSDPQGPELNWVDMSNATIMVQDTEADDTVWGPYSLPFVFTFFDDSFQELYMNSNGFITFTGHGGDFFENTALPGPEAPSALIAPVWDDLEILPSSSISMLQESDRCVIEYRNVRHLDGGQSFSFQVILRNNGNILLQYKDVPWNELSPTVGIQDLAKANGLMVGLNDLEGNVVLILAQPEWIQVEPEEGEVPPDGTIPVTLTVSSQEKNEDFEAKLIFITNNPRQEKLELPIQVQVRAGETHYFLRGDANQDLTIDLADAVTILSHLFVEPSLDCMASADANTDNKIDLADPVFLLQYVFQSGEAPQSPFPDCGAQVLSADGPSCETDACPPN